MYNFHAYKYKGQRMQKLNLTLAAVATLTLIGCGGGGSSTGDTSSTTNNTTQSGANGGANSGTNTTGTGSNNGTGGTTTSGTTAVNTQENNIKARLAYAFLASDLVSGAEKKQCHKMPNGHSYTIKWLVDNTEMNVGYDEYSNENCVGGFPDVRFGSAKYRVTIGNEINGGRAVEVDLQFVSGDDYTNDMPNHILGYDIAKTYYTIAVSAGNYQNQNLVWSVAKPTDTNDGSSPSKRANDVSDYTMGKFYFAQ